MIIFQNEVQRRINLIYIFIRPNIGSMTLTPDAYITLHRALILILEHTPSPFCKGTNPTGYILSMISEKNIKL